MMRKTNVRLRVCGMECPIISEDSEEYIISVGEEINSRVEQITEKNPQLSTFMATILIALEYCDTLRKTEQNVENLRSLINKSNEDIELGKMELDYTKVNLEKVRSELASCKQDLDLFKEKVESLLNEKATLSGENVKLKKGLEDTEKELKLEQEKVEKLKENEKALILKSESLVSRMAELEETTKVLESEKIQLENELENSEKECKSSFDNAGEFD